MRRMTQLSLFLFGIALLLLTACQTLLTSNTVAVEPAGPQTSSGTEFEPGEAVLDDLDSLEELQEIFNRDAGKTRLVLLLSPT